MPGLEKEFGIFVHSFMAGMKVYAVYMLIRLARRIVRHSLTAVSVEDFLFWIGTGFYLFIQIYDTSGGQVRWFLVLGITSGMVFLSVLLVLSGKIAKKMCGKINKRVDKTDKTR